MDVPDVCPLFEKVYMDWWDGEKWVEVDSWMEEFTPPTNITHPPPNVGETFTFTAAP